MTSATLTPETTLPYFIIECTSRHKHKTNFEATNQKRIGNCKVPLVLITETGPVVQSRVATVFTLFTLKDHNQGSTSIHDEVKFIIP